MFILKWSLRMGDGHLPWSHVECVSELSIQGTEEGGIDPPDSVAALIKGSHFHGCVQDQL